MRSENPRPFDNLTRRTARSLVPRLLAVVFGLFLLGYLGLSAYAYLGSYSADPEYLEAALSNPRVEVGEHQTHFALTPDSHDPRAPALVLYPGGLVAPEAYLYHVGATAERLQVQAFVIKPPFNAAIFSVGAARRIMDTHGLDRIWLGGHSLGGIAAARYARSRPNDLEGLLLLASYSDVDLSGFEGRVISIMGEDDGVIDRENYERAKQNLPRGSLLLEIDGMNHSGFGKYGQQRGDGPGELDGLEVVSLIVDSIEPGR